MTQPPAVELKTADLKDGCTGPHCGSQRTVTISSYHGRRCADHATLPPGRFDRALADNMVELGRADCAWAYLRTWTARDIDARFRRAAQAVTG